MLPRLPQTYGVNRSSVDTQRSGNVAACYASRKCSDLANGVLGHHSPMMSRSFRAIASMPLQTMAKNATSMFHVLGVTAPFKVFRLVVVFIAINMINFWFAVQIWMKRQSNHPMEGIGSLLVTEHGSRDAITTPVERAFDDTFWTLQSSERAGLKVIGTGNRLPDFISFAHMPLLA